MVSKMTRSTATTAVSKAAKKVAVKVARVPVTEASVSPLASESKFQVLGCINAGNQLVLFATLSVRVSCIDTLGVIEGGSIPSYITLCKANDPSHLISKDMASVGGLVTLLCANLSPLLVSQETMQVAVMFTDGSRAVQQCKVVSPGSPALGNLLPVLRPVLPLFGSLGEYNYRTNPVLGKLATALIQAMQVLDNPFTGAFDGVVDGRAEGWVYNTLKPQEKIEVMLMEGTRPLAFGTASLFREDLLAAGKADGKVKFSMPLPRRLYDGKPHDLRVLVAEGGQLVGRGPRQFEAPSLGYTPLAELIEFDVSEKLIRAAATKLGERARELAFEREMFKVLVAFDNSEWSAARCILDRLDEPLGGMPLIGLYRGLLELKAGQFSRSIDALFAVVRQAPGFFWAHLALGEAYSCNGEFANAANSFDTASALAPDIQAVQARLQAMHVDNLLKNSEVFKDAGIRHKAIATTKKAILADPHSQRFTAALHKLENPQFRDFEPRSLMAQGHALATDLRHERIVVSVMLEAIGKQQGTVKV